jgi:hypothetical protein
MYQILISKIKDTLESVEAIKEIYAYPLPGNPKKYPAAIFYPDSFENSFETTADNFKVYRFKLFIAVNIAGTTEEDVFTSILPKTVDAVIAAFDTGWNGGTIDGHRLWSILDSGFWTLAIEQQGKTATAEMTLTCRVATTN